MVHPGAAQGFFLLLLLLWEGQALGFYKGPGDSLCSVTDAL